jgi:hypothetical protein
MRPDNNHNLSIDSGLARCKHQLTLNHVSARKTIGPMTIEGGNASVWGGDGAKDIITRNPFPHPAWQPHVEAP